MKRDDRSWKLALIFSLVLHAVLIAFVLTREKIERPQPKAAPITFDFVEVPRPKPVEKKDPIPVNRKSAQKVAKVKKPEEAAPSVASTVPARGSLETVPQSSASTVQNSGSASRADIPKTVNLFPSVTGMLGSSFGGAEREASAGTTVTNGPGEVVDARAVAEYRGEKTKRQLDSMLLSSVASSSRGVGLIDPWFVKALNGMRRELANAPIPESVQKVALNPVQGYFDTVSNYGKTGNPFSADVDSPEVPSMPVEAADRANVHDLEARGSMNGAAQMMATPQAIMKEMHRPRLETLIELEQTASGTLANATILKPSGVPDFDELALHRARKTFIKLEDAPDAGFGIDPSGFRTVWRFRFTPPTISVDLVRVEKGHNSHPFERAPQ